MKKVPMAAALIFSALTSACSFVPTKQSRATAQMKSIAAACQARYDAPEFDELRKHMPLGKPMSATMDQKADKAYPSEADRQLILAVSAIRQDCSSQFMAAAADSLPAYQLSLLAKADDVASLGMQALYEGKLPYGAFNSLMDAQARTTREGLISSQAAHDKEVLAARAAAPVIMAPFVGPSVLEPLPRSNPIPPIQPPKQTTTRCQNVLGTIQCNSTSY